MMPKLLASYVLFLSWDERTCQTQTHLHRMLNTWTWPTIRAQPATCRECSRSVHRLFIVVLLRLLGNRYDAEDAVQEALLAAHKHLHQFRGQAQLATWLTT